jgi:transposase-like protein
MENKGKMDEKGVGGRVRIPQAQRQAAVDAILAGNSTCREIGEQLGVHSTTVWGWVTKVNALTGISPKAKTTASLRNRLAVAVKGGFMTEQEAMKEAGITSPRVVAKWIKALDADIALMEKPAQEAMEEENGVSAQESRTLKAENAQLRLQVLALETLIEVAGEELGQDLRKKYGSKQ